MKLITPYTPLLLVLLIVLSCSGSDSDKEPNAVDDNVNIDNGISQFSDNIPANDVMFQSFWWDAMTDNRLAGSSFYKYYTDKIIELSNAHIDVIWFPPSSEGDGMGYHPRELFEFNSNFGSELELKNLLDLLKQRQMHGMADLVLNHRVGTATWTDFTNPAWGCNSICIDDESYTDPNAFGTTPCGDIDEGEKWGGARDLNHKSTEVQNGIKEYLNRLKSLGFDSWRYDFVKGFPAKYVGEYNDSNSFYYSVGEYWDGNSINIKNWIDKTGTKVDGSSTSTSAAFDFDLKYKLNTAIVNNSYSVLRSQTNGQVGLSAINGYDSKSVTFLDNHDTGCINRTDCNNLFSKSTNLIRLGYVYLLTHPGVPMIWGYHYFFQDSSGSLKKDLNDLIALRKEEGLDANSHVEVIEAINGSNGYYAANIDDKVIVKIGPGNFTPEGNWNEHMSGTNYMIWVTD